MKLRSILLFVCIASLKLAFATHEMGGELRFNHISGLAYSIEVHLYFNPNAQADRPYEELNIDGVVDTVPLTDSIPLPGFCPTVHCIYTIQHVFDGPGVHTITLEDPNRTVGIMNIPNSVSVPLGLSATLIITSFGADNSPRFNAPPSDVNYSWSTLVHDPEVTDPDGDSLSCELVTPLGFNVDPIPGYQLPDAVTPPGDFTWCNPQTGVFLWDHPNIMGYFTIAIRCTEWRNGVMIGEVTRDMLICLGTLPTAINEQENVPVMRILSEGNGMIEVTTNIHHDATIEVFDAQGRSVRTMTTTGERTLIDTRAFAEGIYSVRVIDSEGRVTSGRFIAAY